MATSHGDDSLYLAHAPAIERAITALVRRRHLHRPDAEDFAQDARVHLLQRDCAVLRQFHGSSSIDTFLFRVMSNLFINWQQKRLGRWRPSKAARRAGRLGVTLERLISRDGLAEHEAVQVLDVINGGVPPIDARALIRHLQPHGPPRVINAGLMFGCLGLATAETVTARAWEDNDIRQRVGRALSEVILHLPPCDRRLLFMRFVDGFAVRAIATKCGVDARTMYALFSRLLSELRTRLLQAGVSRGDARSALAGSGLDLDLFAKESERAK